MGRAQQGNLLRALPSRQWFSKKKDPRYRFSRVGFQRNPASPLKHSNAGLCLRLDHFFPGRTLMGGSGTCFDLLRFGLRQTVVE